MGVLFFILDRTAVINGLYESASGTFFVHAGVPNGNSCNFLSPDESHPGELDLSA